MKDDREIDSWMEHVWLRVVKEEYERSRILEESNLHSTVYPVRNNACCSVVGLDFRMILAGFNAPLEFLTGFTFIQLKSRGATNGNISTCKKQHEIV